MGSMKIKFGTSGWRGIIADEFTVSRVRAVTQAIADHLIAQGLKDKGVVVGYDTRFLSERFALEAARVLAACGIHAYLSNRDVPTPVVAFEIIRRKAAGGINFTASHNPPDENGFKVLRGRTTIHGADIQALLLTHGHEDHIGALPFLLARRDVLPDLQVGVGQVFADRRALGRSRGCDRPHRGRARQVRRRADQAGQ